MFIDDLLPMTLLLNPTLASLKSIPINAKYNYNILFHACRLKTISQIEKVHKMLKGHSREKSTFSRCDKNFWSDLLCSEKKFTKRKAEGIKEVQLWP